jgi:hypothetical protein
MAVAASMSDSGRGENTRVMGQSRVGAGDRAVGAGGGAEGPGDARGGRVGGMGWVWQ